MPRRKKIRNRLRLRLKRKTILSLISLIFFFLGILAIFSFIQEGSIPTKINLFLLEWFGFSSFLLPFLLFCFGFAFSQIKTALGQMNIWLGATILWLSLLALTKGGLIGNLIWARLEFLITPVGNILVLLAGVVIGVLVLFNTSLDQLIEFFLRILTTIKRYLVAPKKKIAKPIFWRDQKSEETVSEREGEIPGPPPVLLSKQTAVGASADFLTQDKGLLTQSQREQIWHYPPIEIFQDIAVGQADRGDVNKNAATIERTLDSFGITAKVVEVNRGPSVTQYALEVALGTKLSKITALSNDLALALAAPTGQIRIEAPIPGRSLVGIEVPNRSLQIVSLKHMLNSAVMREAKSKLQVPLGLDVSGKPLAADVSKMPHILIAGQTGSGKSILLNSWIATLLFRTSPDEVRLILVDPKRVEMGQFNGVPHLLAPIIHDPHKVISALNWAIKQMEERYKIFAQVGARNINAYNELAGIQRLPYILIIIDELADIILFSPAQVEDTICRIAQMARATGIHLILATQRPSVDVITGLIKANIPCRISFAVASMTDSRVILDTPGAEKLLGRGDMLYIPPDQAKPTRIQGPYVTDEEIVRLIEFLKGQQEASYETQILSQPVMSQTGSRTVMVNGEERDELFKEAAELVIRHKKASVSLLQRKFHIGFARAGRIIDKLEEAGIVGPDQGSKPREVLVDFLPSEFK